MAELTNLVGDMINVRGREDILVENLLHEQKKLPVEDLPRVGEEIAAKLTLEIEEGISENLKQSRRKLMPGVIIEFFGESEAGEHVDVYP